MAKAQKSQMNDEENQTTPEQELEYLLDDMEDDVISSVGKMFREQRRNIRGLISAIDGLGEDKAQDLRKKIKDTQGTIEDSIESSFDSARNELIKAIEGAKKKSSKGKDLDDEEFED